jgi:hypothetical protein
MKKRTLHQFVLFALIACLVPMLAYARKYPLTATPIVPGAKGYVDVGQDKNGNTEVHLKSNFFPNRAVSRRQPRITLFGFANKAPNQKAKVNSR